MPTHTASLTLRSTPQAITAMNPFVMHFSSIKHSPKPMPWSQTPPFSASPDPSNGTGRLTQHPPVALDHTVARWLYEGAPRVNSRSHPNPATRPFIPAALFSFLDGAISLPESSQVIAQHHAWESNLFHLVYSTYRLLELMLQAKLTHPIMIGLWARSTNNSFGHFALGIAKSYDPIVGNRIMCLMINCYAVIHQQFQASRNQYTL